MSPPLSLLEKIKNLPGLDACLKKSSGNMFFGYLFRFCTVGAFATLVYFLVANLLMFFNVASPETCSVIAYLVGMVISYLGQSNYTFNVTDKSHSQFIRFSVLSFVGLYISYLSVDYAVNVYNVSAFWGTVITSVSIPVFSFFIMKTWVFNK